MCNFQLFLCLRAPLSPFLLGKGHPALWNTPSGGHDGGDFHFFLFLINFLPKVSRPRCVHHWWLHGGKVVTGEPTVGGLGAGGHRRICSTSLHKTAALRGSPLLSSSPILSFQFRLFSSLRALDLLTNSGDWQIASCFYTGSGLSLCKRQNSKSVCSPSNMCCPPQS